MITCNEFWTEYLLNTTDEIVAHEGFSHFNLIALDFLLGNIHLLLMLYARLMRLKVNLVLLLQFTKLLLDHQVILR